MRYITSDDAARNGISLDVGNIHRSGSVRGMQQLYGWPKGGQVRVGSYIYNVGTSVVAKAEELGILRG